MSGLSPSWQIEFSMSALGESLRKGSANLDSLEGDGASFEFTSRGPRARRGELKRAAMAEALLFYFAHFCRMLRLRKRVLFDEEQLVGGF
jgi:hypothetical protein